MSQKLPPVPPGSRSTKGPGEPARRAEDAGTAEGVQSKDPDKVGQTANTVVNTTNQGLQQDR